MSSMISFRFSLPSFLSWGAREPARAIDLPSVEIADMETGKDKRTRTLKHLIKANHTNFSIIYNELRFHNHMPHLLGSAYFFSSTPEHLNDIYDYQSKHMEPWHDSPSEISKDDWRDFLGKKEYQRAFVDFFEDQLVQLGYDWKALLEEYAFKGDEPLINGMLVGGLAHPMIHLGYGHELSSHTVAVEALAMGACFYGSLHKYLDDPRYSSAPAPSASPPDPLSILHAIRRDPSFDGLFTTPGPSNIGPLFALRESAVLGHWNAWQLASPTAQFRASQRAAAALLVGSVEGAHTGPAPFDFFFVHLLTSSHAARILLPAVPARAQVPLVRQWWLFTVAVYIAQLRPAVDLGRIEGVELRGRGWDDVQKSALGGDGRFDAHYVKVLRALREAARTWGDEDDFYLKAAIRFVDNWGGWKGFGVDEIEDESTYNGG